MKVCGIIIFYFSILVQDSYGQAKPESKVQSKGYIKLADAENKIYMIVTQNGMRYFPLNLEKKFKRDGLKVMFNGVIDTARLRNVRLAGYPINIKSIKIQ